MAHAINLFLLFTFPGLKNETEGLQNEKEVKLHVKAFKLNLACLKNHLKDFNLHKVNSLSFEKI